MAVVCIHPSLFLSLPHKHTHTHACTCTCNTTIAYPFLCPLYLLPCPFPIMAGAVPHSCPLLTRHKIHLHSGPSSPLFPGGSAHMRTSAPLMYSSRRSLSLSLSLCVCVCVCTRVSLVSSTSQQATVLRLSQRESTCIHMFTHRCSCGTTRAARGEDTPHTQVKWVWDDAGRQ